MIYTSIYHIFFQPLDTHTLATAPVGQISTLQLFLATAEVPSDDQMNPTTATDVNSRKNMEKNMEKNYGVILVYQNDN